MTSGAERVERIARWVAIVAAVILVGFVSVIALAEVTGAFHELRPSALRRGLRLARGAGFIVPVAAVVLLVALLVGKQARDHTWRNAGALAVFVLGGVLLIAGIANVVALPWGVFPSQSICVFDYDIGLCELRPWAGAPIAMVLGGVLVLIGAYRNRARGSLRG